MISINEIPCKMCGKPIGSDHTHWTEEVCPICRTCGDRMHSAEPTPVPMLITPPMIPTVYTAGIDLKRMEFLGCSREAMEARPWRITIQLIGGEKWFVLDGESCALSRDKLAPGIVAFVYGLAAGTPCATSAEAYALLVEYLNQPINPYAWIRDNVD